MFIGNQQPRLSEQLILFDLDLNLHIKFAPSFMDYLKIKNIQQS
jgi:hypothetical protein